MNYIDRHAFDAEYRALRQYLADLPDAAEFAQELPLTVAEALARAEPGRLGLRARDLRDADMLRTWGLCDYPTRESDGRNLTNYGRDVRRELLEGGMD